MNTGAPRFLARYFLPGTAHHFSGNADRLLSDTSIYLTRPIARASTRALLRLLRVPTQLRLNGCMAAYLLRPSPLECSNIQRHVTSRDVGQSGLTEIGFLQTTCAEKTEIQRLQTAKIKKRGVVFKCSVCQPMCSWTWASMLSLYPKDEKLRN